jgi:hypothetical protein
MTLDLQSIARALGGEVSGDQVLAPGPGHLPKDRSLSVKIDSTAPDGFLVHSFAGEDAIALKDYVRSRAGLPAFKPNGRRNGHSNTSNVDELAKGRVVATYRYTDNSGKLLYEVLRYEPKTFRQRRPDGKGGWIWSVKGCQRVPYRLSDLLKYPDGSVFVTEGEKDADRVALLGQCATTVACGDWTEDCIRALAGRDVLILEDNDEAGRKKAHDAAQALHGVAKTIRIVRLRGLPNKGDVSNWLDTDPCNAAKFVDVCLDAPLWTPAEKLEDEPRNSPTGTWRDNTFTAATLRSKQFKVIDYVVPDLIPEGLTILAGKPKIGKSWLALDIALAVAGGRFVLGEIRPDQGDVLYAALEDNQRRLQKRTRKVMGGDNAWPQRLMLATRWRRLDAGGIDDIREWASSVTNPRLVILDTLAGVRPERSSRDTLYDGDYKALRELHDWANEVGIAVLVLHHTRKMEADDPIDTISGSLGLAGCADTNVILSRGGKGTTLYIRGRDVEEQEHAVTFSAETCRWTILGDAAEVHQTYTRGKLSVALQEANKPMSPADLIVATGLSKQNVDTTLHRMVKDGKIVRLSRGMYALANRPTD